MVLPRCGPDDGLSASQSCGRTLTLLLLTSPNMADSAHYIESRQTCNASVSINMATDWSMLPRKADNNGRHQLPPLCVATTGAFVLRLHCISSPSISFLGTRHASSRASHTDELFRPQCTGCTLNIQRNNVLAVGRLSRGQTRSWLRCHSLSITRRNPYAKT